MAGGLVLLALIAWGCAARRDTVEIEVEETITTTSTDNTTTTIRRGPAPGWERRGDP